MQDSVSVSAAFTKEDYVRVLTFMQNSKVLCRYGFVFVFALIFVGMLTFILYLGQDSDEMSFSSSVLTALFPAIVGAALAFVVDRLLLPFLLRRSIAKQFKSSLALGATYQITVDESGISSSSKFSSSTLNWDVFVRGVETETDFLFYTTNQCANFLPKSLFKSEEEIDFVRKLARRKLAERAEF